MGDHKDDEKELDSLVVKGMILRNLQMKYLKVMMILTRKRRKMTTAVMVF